MRHTNASIDCCRFFVACFVVLIHSGVSSISSNLYNIFQAGVPLFFVITGFFLDRKKTLFATKNYIHKTSCLYVIWSLMYLPLTIYGCRINEYTLNKDILFTLHGFFIKGENFYSWPLWYLLATIYAVVLYYFTLKNNWSNEKIIFSIIIVSSVGYAMEVFSDIKFISKLKFLIGGTRNGIFQGFPYLMIGVLINRYQIPEKILSKKKYLIGILLMLIVVSSFLTFTKSFFVNHIICCLLISILLSAQIKFNVDTTILRRLGIWMYFIHMYIIYFIGTLVETNNFFVLGPLALTLSFFVSCLLELLANRFNFVNRLITG